jgi:hypothetical protein
VVIWKQTGGIMLKDRKKKLSKFKLIPKIGSPVREIIIEKLTELPDYKKALERGLRFFTEGQLLQIEAEYKGGMTWAEINTVMSSQGMLLKQATFRKYMQDGIISKANNYKSRVAIYDNKIIRQLNFVNFFYNVTDAPMIDFLMEVTNGIEISEYDASESQLENGSSGYLYVEIIKEIAGFSERYASEAIEKALANRDDKDDVLKMLCKIEDKFNKYIAKDIEAFCNYLKSNQMLITQIPDENQQSSAEVIP